MLTLQDLCPLLRQVKGTYDMYDVKIYIADDTPFITNLFKECKTHAKVTLLSPPQDKTWSRPRLTSKGAPLTRKLWPGENFPLISMKWHFSVVFNLIVLCNMIYQMDRKNQYH